MLRRGMDRFGRTSWFVGRCCVLLLLLTSVHSIRDEVPPTEITDEVQEIVERPLRFTSGLSDKTSNIGRSVTLSCSIEGSPPLNLFMYHDKIATFKMRNRRRLHDVEIVYDPAEPSKLKVVRVIGEVSADDGGIYKCQGESVDGSVVVSSAQLTLIDPCEGVVCGFREQCLNHKGTDICTCDFECHEDKPVCAGGISTYSSMCHLERAECRMGTYVDGDITEGACPDIEEINEAGCSISGEGHVTMFNGDYFSFKGSCPYLMAKDTRRGVFVAYARTDACGNDEAGVCLRSITMYVDRIYGFSLERGSVINDNGRSRTVSPGEDIILGRGAVSITRVGKTLVGTILEKNIKFYYDGLNYFKLSVPLDYVSSRKDFTGFCGHVPVDTMPSIGRDVSFTGSVSMYGLGPNKASCEPVIGMASCVDTELAESVRAVFTEDASLAACASAVPAGVFIERAASDVCMCAHNDKNYCLCNVVFSYIEECRQAGVTIAGSASCAKSFYRDVFKLEGVKFNQKRKRKFSS